MTPGPIPKRSTERTRNNKTGEDGLEIKRGVAQPYEWTDPSFDWEKPIQRYYESFQKSGMAAYFQQTDVEQLWMACEWMNRQWASGRPSAMILQEAMKMTDGLGATEGERRRLKIELDKPKVDDSADKYDAKITDIRDRLSQSASNQ